MPNVGIGTTANGIIEFTGNDGVADAGIAYNNAVGSSLTFHTGGAGALASTRMTIDSAGNVGIGLTNPTYQLQLSTDSAAKPGTSTWTIASDERLKDIRAPFNRSLEALDGLNTIYFNYKKDNPLGLPSNKEFVGIKAQDVLKVIPEAVSQDDDGFYHVTNDSIIWTAVNAIKELYHKWSDDSQALHSEIASVKVENAAKEKEITELKTKAAKAEADNAAMKVRLEKLEKMLK